QHRRGRRRPDALGPRNLVGRIAAERDEVWHLRRLDAVALAHLGGADTGDLADAANGLKDGGAVARELERVAVGRGDEDLAAARFLGVDVGAEEVVGLVPGRLR